MDTIADIQFVSMSGEPGGFGQQVRQENRDGFDGIIAWQVGNKGQPFQIQTTQTFISLSALNAAYAYYEALQGTYVSMNYRGLEFNNILVVSVNPGAPQQMLFSSDGNTWIFQAVWTLQRTESKT
jgi:hypothetical protein